MTSRFKRSPPPSRRQPAAPAAQNSVFSYHANRARSESVKRQPKLEIPASLKRDRIFRRRWLHNMPSLVALMIILGSLACGLLLDSNPKIVTAGANPTNQSFLRDRSDYQATAQQILQHSLDNRFKLTLNTNKVANQLQQTYPELSDVSISLPLLGRRPVISLQATDPVLIVTSQSQAYVVDNRGLAIMKTTEATAFAKSLPVVNDEGGLPIVPGKLVLSTPDVQFITATINQLAAKKLTVSSMALTPAARELHVRLQGQTYYLKLNLNTNSRLALGTFLATKQRLEAEHTPPAEYIDLRVEGRAYVK